jgi:hypothetical protein
MNNEQPKRMTVIELCAYMRDLLPPGISEPMIYSHIRRAGLKKDKRHRVDVQEFLDAYAKSKENDNKVTSKAAGIEPGQDPKREKTILECKILREKLATIKGEQILVTAHHAEIQELAGHFTACFAQWISEVKVLTGDAKLVTEAERLRDRTLEYARNLIEQNTQKGKS